MKIFFFILASLVGLFGVVMVGGGVYVALFWVREAEFALDGLAVLALALLIVAFGAVFILAAVRFFKDPQRRTAKDMAGVSCFLVWAFLPRKSFSSAVEGHEQRLLELLPLAISLLVALLLYRLVFVRWIERTYPPGRPPDPLPSIEPGS